VLLNCNRLKSDLTNPEMMQGAGNDSEDLGVVRLETGDDSEPGFFSTAARGLREALEHRSLLQEGLLAQAASGGGDDPLQGHLPSLLHGFSDAAQVRGLL
jgi:hypothetical protein